MSNLARQSITPPPSAPTAGPAGDERLIQDDSPEYRKAVAKAEAACSSIDAKHVEILTNMLAANKATGKTRAGSIRVARDWCRQESILDAGYERCISALSTKLWGEGSVPIPTPRAKQGEGANAEKRSQEEVVNADKWKLEEAKQPERRELIQKLIGQGVFRKVEFRARAATIWVDSSFYFLDFEDKEDFASVVYAYVATNAKDDLVSVTLKDALSGKTVGDYGYQWTRFGLKME